MATLLTLLGTGNYGETVYYTEERPAERTCYVAKALCELFAIERVILLLTAEAEEMHWSRLRASLPPHIEAVPRRIPAGETEAETWAIFDVLVDSIEPGTRLIFDITHAFRSIPLLVLLGAAFLSKAKQVQIERICYGLYRPNQERSPIIDLTPAVRLLDWLTATDKFISTGSAMELGQLLDNIQRDFYRQSPGREVPRPTCLQSFGQAIRDVSRSLELLRPITLLRDDLPRLQQRFTEELEEEVGQFAKPLGLLLQAIQESYGQLNLPPEPEAVAEVQKQFQLLRWYVDRGLTSQAILLAREWVLSALCIYKGVQDYIDRECREGIEKQLGCLTSPEVSPEQKDPVSREMADLRVDAQAIANFWHKLGTYRNDLAHAQMREDRLSGQRLENFAAKELIDTLCQLFPDLTQAGQEVS